MTFPGKSLRFRSRAVHVLAAVAALAAVTAIAGASAAVAASPETGFGFNARGIAGFPSGAVFLTGGGAFDAASGRVHSGGGFRCTEQVNQGPLMGCGTGQGVRWDTAALLSNTSFKCTGAAGETLKSVSTGRDTAVLQADFYRAGDGNDESFTANMIVSANDIAPDVTGVQNVWVQGVGCAAAVVHFSA
jgi:hypothetical protein